MVVPRAEDSASVVVGVAHSRRASVDRLGVRALGRELFEPFCEEPKSAAVGVGQHEDALSFVRSSNVERAQTAPLRIEPEAGQIGEHVVEPTRKQSSDILEQDDVGSLQLEHAGELVPKSRARARGEPCTLARCADVLARKAAHDGVRARHRACSDLPNVGNDAMVGAGVLPDELAAESGALDAVEAPRAHERLECEVESADPGERRAIRDHLLRLRASTKRSPAAVSHSATGRGGVPSR